MYNTNLSGRANRIVNVIGGLALFAAAYYILNNGCRMAYNELVTKPSKIEVILEDGNPEIVK